MAIDPTVATLIGAGIGALAGVTGSVVTVLVTQIHESKRHLREVTLKTAFDQWTTDRKFAEDRNLSMPPLSTYLIGMMKLVEVANQGKITPELALAWTKEANAVIAVMHRENVEFTNREQGDKKPDH